MHLIKPCPVCGTRVRFPIDRGVVQVTCRCGYTFRADPDDPALYRNGRFDLKEKKKPSSFKRSIPDIQGLQDLPGRIVNFFLNLKYDTQNLPLLTDRDRFLVIVRLVAVGTILFLGIITILWLIFPSGR
jgi:hypothetical protein